PGQMQLALHHLVEHHGDLAQDAVPALRQLAPERAVPDRGQCGEQLAQVIRVDRAGGRRGLLGHRGHRATHRLPGWRRVVRTGECVTPGSAGYWSVWHDRIVSPHRAEGLTRPVTSLGALGVHASFAPTAESVAAARRMVRKALAQWPVGEAADDALLVVSE